MKILTPLVWVAVLTLTLLASSCDDGFVEDPVYEDDGVKYSVQLTATFHGLDQWPDSFSVVLAGFNDETRYSLIQKNLPHSADTGVADTIRLSSIPSNASSVELAVVDTLRRKVVTISKLDIVDDQDPYETLAMNLGVVDVSPFGAVNTAVFNGTSLSCARCHQGTKAAAGLDLSPEEAYQNLVGVPSVKAEGQTLVVPGNADQSFLYQVITQGSNDVHYAHPNLFVESDVAPLTDLVKLWIDLGAKQ